MTCPLRRPLKQLDAKFIVKKSVMFINIGGFFYESIPFRIKLIYPEKFMPRRHKDAKNEIIRVYADVRKRISK